MGSPSAVPLSVLEMCRYKERLSRCLDYTLTDSVIPELGMMKKGKVRDVYVSKKHVFMICSDRVSAFDCILDNHIPFKADVLNKISIWAFNQTKDIVPNALVDGKVMDANVIVQKRLRPLMVECIVRGFMWGSMAGAYEKGQREFCGLSLPEGMLRYQKLAEPLFTPTNKAPEGEHDVNITMEEMAMVVGGRDMSEKLRKMSFLLYERGSELAKSRGLLLLDSKYEFGVDQDTGEVLVMDEVNTPDSSRLCDIAEWECKFHGIREAMQTQKQYKSVTCLLEQHPELKIQEFSKQYVRDVLLQQGFEADKQKHAMLTNEQVVECAYRYICVYERITGETFHFPDMTVSPSIRLLQNLKRHDFIKGCAVIMMAGSNSDAEHLNKLKAQMRALNIPSFIRICSAHKQCAKLESMIGYYNRSLEPLLIVACAGGTDALSGCVSFSSVFPVVSCPPDGMNTTCLNNPSQSANALILRPDNVAKFALQMFSSVNEEYRQMCLEGIKLKRDKLHQADKKFMEMDCETS